MTKEDSAPKNFIRAIIDADLTTGDRSDAVITRFPPEPNGFLHIGHAKSICLNFGIAEDYDGLCNLRFDDTNPETENMVYVEAIQADVKWLGFRWAELRYASDYFAELYQYAIDLIKAGKAYVDSLNNDQIRAYRGTLIEPGRNSPYRDRAVEENLALFEAMKSGKFADGEHVLRAKIDMASPNINMRDPVIYRIKHARHYRTHDDWCIYPMYDYTHCISDALERITHSLCTLEFEDHRPLYDWVLDQLDVQAHPQQIEFARLSLEYTVMSKRLLHSLITDDHVHGWDDPRLPTISGLRRRGYTPQSIRDFCDRIGVTKKDGMIEMSVLENTLREDLNTRAKRAMAVLKPLKVVIDNYPEDQVEDVVAQNHPKNSEMGTRKLPFSRTLYIECDDFMENPSKKFFRLALGREVRLRYAYYITCTEMIKDASGDIVELRCKYDPQTRGGSSPDGRKVKGTIHWVSAAHAIDAEVRLYDRLFTVPNPVAEADFVSALNPQSLVTLVGCKLEPHLADITPGEPVQFERQGYFCMDSEDSRPDHAVFNRAVTLRDSWTKAKSR
ncbi:MAG: glutamine--tRNA ligase/YqeY domain fusion protein [Gammaproteobacteria bacterium]|nr:glutamine--tRNA ligase/YqeY domain fusion protein [Gammaproteobacteria bacterium]